MIELLMGADVTAGFHPDAKALIARMSGVTLARKVLINAMITKLANQGVWSKIDVLYVFAADTSGNALLNWKSASNNPSINSAPTFTADRGYAGDGAAAYISAGGYGFGTGQFTEDDHHVGVWMRSASTGGYNFGINDFTVSGYNVSIQYAGANSVNYEDATTGNQSNFTIPGGVGHQAISRSSHTTYNAYAAGAALGSPAQVALLSAASPFHILAINSNGSASNFTSGQAAAWHAGASLTGTDVANLYNAMQAYMTAVGA